MLSYAKSLEESVVHVFDLNLSVPSVCHLYRMANLTNYLNSVNA